MIPRLLLVTNRKTARMPLPALAVRAIAGGVDLVQIREKDLCQAELRALVSEVVNAAGDRHRLTVNGSPEIASEFGIGLHLPERAAIISPGQFRPISRSVHSAESARDSDGMDFLVAGHVFPTDSKADLAPIGLNGFARIARAATAPVLAIGGMTPERVPEVVESGAYGVAALSAINDAADPEAAARAFRKALVNAMTEQLNTITVSVNGKDVAVPAGATVLDYLKERGHHDRLVVVEVNGHILPKSSFPTTELTAGDRVEIVHFVGGG